MTHRNIADDTGKFVQGVLIMELDSTECFFVYFILTEFHLNSFHRSCFGLTVFLNFTVQSTHHSVKAEDVGNEEDETDSTKYGPRYNYFNPLGF